MSKEFQKPDFSDKDIELRFVDNEICIYATKTGLKELIKHCQTLIDKHDTGHIHLEDYNVLTKDSLNGVIAVFQK